MLRTSNKYIYIYCLLKKNTFLCVIKSKYLTTIRKKNWKVPRLEFQEVAAGLLNQQFA